MYEQVNYCPVRYSAQALIGLILLLFVVFPYLQLMPSESYTQPYALLLGAFLFFAQGLPVFRRLAFIDQVCLMGFALVGIGIFLATCFPYEDRQEYKYLVSYLSPALLTIPLLAYLKSHKELAVGILKFSILIWILTAGIQKFIDPNFLGFLIGNWSESAIDIIQSGRGVLGLAPEPTHHAFHILLLAACFALLIPGEQNRWILVLCVVDALVMAASASAFLVLGISVLVWMFCYRPFWLVVTIILATCLLLFWTWGIFDQASIGGNTRIEQLVRSVLEDPRSILTVDYSMNNRLGGMIAVILETFHNSFIPHGMSHQLWEGTRENLLSNLTWLIDLSNVGPPSGIGMIIFQSGIFGGILIWLIFSRILASHVNSLGRILILATPIIFLGQYYISAPTFSLLYACAIWNLDQKSETSRVTCNSSGTLGTG